MQFTFQIVSPQSKELRRNLTGIFAYHIKHHKEHEKIEHVKTNHQFLPCLNGNHKLSTETVGNAFLVKIIDGIHQPQRDNHGTSLTQFNGSCFINNRI